MELTLAMLDGIEPDQALEPSPWTAVEQEQIDRFADATGDHQWIHVDAERAKDGPFGTTIAHGYLLLSLIPRLLFQILTFPDAGMVVNYGLDKLRFLKPVPAGSRVRLTRGRLVSAKPRGEGYLVRLRASLEIEGSSRALVSDVLLLVLPPDAEAR